LKVFRNFKLGLLFFVALAVTACDEVPGINNLDKSPPQLTELTLSPGDITFSRQFDGVKDTIITYQLSVKNKLGGPLDSPPQYYITDNDLKARIKEGEITNFNPSAQTYTTSFTISSNTNLFRNFTLTVYALNNENELGNRITRTFKLSGVPGIKPLISDAAITPSRAQIPAAGQAALRIDFTADVQDPDGVDNIESVFMRLISETTGPLGSPFLLTAGATTGNTRRYSTSFEINSGNSPDKVRVLFYADDKSGLRSDTLVRNLEIVR
jgi:hypothetical protein